MNELSYRLEALDFDGPLDLLLRLIAKNKIDIYDIPIAEITRQYLDYVHMLEERDLDVIADFLLMAATLLDIKARMLLPKNEEQDEEEEDPREELVKRLLAYKRIKYISRELLKSEEYAQRFLYKEEDIPEEIRGYERPADLDALLDGVTAEALQSVFREVLMRKEFKTDERHSEFGRIRRERIPLGKRIGSLISYARKKRKFSFRELLDKSRSREEVVVAFLAVLELMKTGRLTARQRGYGSDIELSATDEIDKDMDLSSVEDA